MRGPPRLGEGNGALVRSRCRPLSRRSRSRCAGWPSPGVSFRLPTALPSTKTAPCSASRGAPTRLRDPGEGVGASCIARTHLFFSFVSRFFSPPQRSQYRPHFLLARDGIAGRLFNVRLMSAGFCCCCFLFPLATSHHTDTHAHTHTHTRTLVPSPPPPPQTGVGAVAQVLFVAAQLCQVCRLLSTEHLCIFSKRARRHWCVTCVPVPRPRVPRAPLSHQASTLASLFYPRSLKNSGLRRRQRLPRLV